MHIYFLCPDTNTPFGGIKQLYRHVDILNKYGFTAHILHEKKGFRCTWFSNNTPVTYMEDIKLYASDFVVLPENYGPNMAQFAGGVKKIIFNQGCYNTFKGYNLDLHDYTTPYNNAEVIATIVVSKDSRNYLRYVFPDLKVFRIHNGIDQTLFKYQPKKEKIISLMLNKSIPDIIQVINILKFRGTLNDYNIAFIKDRTQADVAAIMQQSLIFLSFGYQEGFSLPPAEAMSCGCMVIGYHGNGGKEFFNPEFSYPIPQGDVLKFVRTIEAVIELNNLKPDLIREKGQNAAKYIQNNYSLKIEEEDIIKTWKNIIKKPVLN